LIHGTKDLICSPENSDALQQALPEHQVTRYNVLSGHIGEAVNDDASVLASESIASSIVIRKNQAFKKEFYNEKPSQNDMDMPEFK